jgi:signal transduction histidine kinase
VNDPVTDPSPVPVGEAARDAWETVAAPHGRLHVDGTPVVLGDPGRVHTLLENLFRNSVEHGVAESESAHESAECVGVVDSVGTDSGRASDHADAAITVTVDELDDGRGFAVSDDGRGIPEPDRERVLEFGYSSDGGTGLGLGIVTGIADAHGWSVEVTDSSGGGARFEIREETLDTFVS